jgi:hypothetical protein
MLMKLFKKWWRTETYSVDIIRAHYEFGMTPDKKKFDNLENALKRMIELANMNEEDIIKEVGFAPSSFRIIMVIGPNPIRRFLNACGSKRMYRIGPFRI